jgi:hypothetical protein
MIVGDSWAGIPHDRVVAVVARLATGRILVGSGYLATKRHILTASHCVMDSRICQPALSLSVTRLSDRVTVSATVLAEAFDIAVLLVEDLVSGTSAKLEPIKFGRVDRSHTGELDNCEAIGFPRWQLDPEDEQRNAAEIRGSIRLTDDVASGRLVMRDSLLTDVAAPTTATGKDRTKGSLWGGLSGSLVFWQGIAIGIVTKHHPRQGASALTIHPLESLVAAAEAGDPQAAAVALALKLPPMDGLILIRPTAGASAELAWIRGQIESVLKDMEALSLILREGVGDIQRIKRSLSEDRPREALSMLQSVIGGWQESAPSAARNIPAETIISALRLKAKEEHEKRLAKVTVAFDELAMRVGVAAASCLKAVSQEIQPIVQSLNPNPVTKNSQRDLMKDMADQVNAIIPQMIVDQVTRDTRLVLVQARQVIEDEAAGFRQGLEEKLSEVGEQVLPDAPLRFGGTEGESFKERVILNGEALIEQTLGNMSFDDMEELFDWDPYDPDTGLGKILLAFFVIVFFGMDRDMVSMETALRFLSRKRKIAAAREKLYIVIRRELYSEKLMRQVATVAGEHAQNSFSQLRSQVRSWLDGVVEHLDSEEFVAEFAAGMPSIDEVLGIIASRLDDIGTAWHN